MSECPKCHEEIRAGEIARRTVEGGWAHVGCPTARQIRRRRRLGWRLPWLRRSEGTLAP